MTVLSAAPVRTVWHRATVLLWVAVHALILAALFGGWRVPPEPVSPSAIELVQVTPEAEAAPRPAEPVMAFAAETSPPGMVEDVSPPATPLDIEAPADPAPRRQVADAPALPEPPEPVVENAVSDTPEPPGPVVETAVSDTPERPAPAVAPPPAAVIPAPPKPVRPPPRRPVLSRSVPGPTVQPVSPSRAGQTASLTAAPIAAAPSGVAVPPDRVEETLRGRIREAVQAAVRCPAAARMMGLSGTAGVAFDYRDGTLAGAVRLTRSTGAPMLDDAALAAVRDARYPKPPPEIANHMLRLLVWVEEACAA